MTSSAQRLKSRKRQKEIRNQINNEKKLKKLQEERRGKRITTRKRVDGKLVTTSYYTGGNKISNIGKNADFGQRKGKIGNLPSDYKKTEKKAFKNAKQEKKKLIQERKDKKKGSSSLKIGKYFTWKGKRYRSGSVTARKAENQMRARKRAQEMARNRK